MIYVLQRVTFLRIWVLLTLKVEFTLIQNMVTSGFHVQVTLLLMLRVDIIMSGDLDVREIQSRIEAIRDALDVIEGNLVDYVDGHTSDSP